MKTYVTIVLNNLLHDVRYVTTEMIVKRKPLSHHQDPAPVKLQVIARSDNRRAQSSGVTSLTCRCMDDA